MARNTIDAALRLWNLCRKGGGISPMFEIYRHPLIKFGIFAAIVCGILYIRNVFFSFILSLVYYTKFNVPSIAYTILRTVTILFPLVLLTPFSKKITRLAKMRVMFVLMGICYLLGNTWVFYHLAYFPFSTLFDMLYLRQFQYNNAYVLNYLVWNCHTLWGVLFSTIQGILYLILAKHIGGPRKKALLLYGIILAISIVVPIVYTLFDSTLPILEWGQKNILLILSQALTYLSFYLLGKSRYDWEEFLWLC